MKTFEYAIEVDALAAASRFEDAAALLPSSERDWRNWLLFLARKPTEVFNDPGLQSITKAWQSIDHGCDLQRATTELYKAFMEGRTWQKAWASLGLAKIAGLVWHPVAGLAWSSHSIAISRRAELPYLLTAGLGIRGELFLKSGCPMAALECYQADLDLLPASSDFKSLVLCRRGHAFRALAAIEEARLSYLLAAHSPGHSMKHEAWTGLSLLELYQEKPPSVLMLEHYKQKIEKLPTRSGTCDFWCAFTLQYASGDCAEDQLTEILGGQPCGHTELNWLMGTPHSSIEWIFPSPPSKTNSFDQFGELDPSPETNIVPPYGPAFALEKSELLRQISRLPPFTYWPTP